ncbi:hypothetical protein [Desertivirga arenae]|uniref:hypothetical protein n=1 Tax=Desertivirga arenae TaxID=2810309 RepID=UPI001A95CC70|nr:hypothetical protein [Pedobacter sp. SYSU D00823]
MKSIQILLIISLLSINFSYCQRKTLTIIGTVHFPSRNFNADTLFKILENTKPDIVLLELDSALFSRTFDKDFKLKYQSKENEPVATSKYIHMHPLTKAGYFDFPNRDYYRNQRGIKQAEINADQLLDSLYRIKVLTKRQAAIVKKFYALTEELNSYVERPLTDFNNSKTDRLAKRRQFYQHHKIRKVINECQEFSERTVKTNSGLIVSLKEAYGSLCDFWDLRNKTMSANILNVCHQNPGKKVVVLTGFFHRYYLIKEIQGKDRRL